MMKQSGTSRQTSSASLAQRSLWIAYLSCSWALLFAALSFFWAAGGRTGLHPLEQQAASNHMLWIAVNLSAGVLKAIGGLMVVVLARSSGQKLYRKLLFFLAWVGGGGMFLYGFFGLISDILHVTGVINDPQTWKWFFFYLILWDPLWILGGVLFLATAWSVRRSDRESARSLD